MADQTALNVLVYDRLGQQCDNAGCTRAAAGQEGDGTSSAGTAATGTRALRLRFERQGEGLVNTVGYFSPKHRAAHEAFMAGEMRDGYIVNRDGVTISPVIHQYDRLMMLNHSVRLSALSAAVLGGKDAKDSVCHFGRKGGAGAGWSWSAGTKATELICT